MTSGRRYTGRVAVLARTLDRACRDCHSNGTNWRWYTYVAPVSWWTIGHVTEARAEPDLSEWGTYGPRLRETRLRAMCQLAERRTMPPSAYARMHSEARLSADDIHRLCAWTTQALDRDATER